MHALVAHTDPKRYLVDICGTFVSRKPQNVSFLRSRDYCLLGQEIFTDIWEENLLPSS
jgi:hypothetical protein